MPEWLRPPVSNDEERNWSGRVLHIICLCLIPGLSIALVHNAWAGATSAVLTLLAEMVCVALAFALNRTGRLNLAAGLLVSSFLITSTVLLSTSGFGFHDPALMIFPTLLVTAAVLLDRRFFLGFTAASLLFVAGVAVAEMHGWITSKMSDFTSVRSLLDVLVITLLTAVAVGLMGGGLKTALRKVRRNRADLAASYAELKEQSRRLSASEERFRSTIELAVDAILLADSTGRITDANSKACELTGLPKAELVGRPVAELFESGEAGNLSPAGGLLRDGVGEVSEQTLRGQGDRRVPVELSWRRMPDGTFQFFARDTTERRHLEERLRQAQKMEAVGVLAGGVAHDFNNILTVIRGHVDLLLDERALPPAFRGSLAEMRAASDRARELTQRLLAFSRRQVIQTRPQRLDELVANLGRMFERVLGEDIVLEFVQEAEAPWVQVDASMIEQVVMNLVINARDALPKGGRLTLATAVVNRPEQGPPTDRQSADDRWVCLRVTDTGCGMDAATLAHVFEPFFTTKPVGKGTGLGLATVYGIVQQHGGWVDVESTPGLGSSFLVYLPLVSPPAVTPMAARLPSDSPGGQETILLVEDEAAVRRLAAGILRRLGYEVLEAGNGVEAEALWEREETRIHLLLTDMVMPEGISGHDLAARFRSRRPRLPVIIASGYSQEMVDRQFTEMTGVCYLPKPYDLSGLAQTVRASLDGNEPGPR